MNSVNSEVSLDSTNSSIKNFNSANFNSANFNSINSKSSPKRGRRPGVVLFKLKKSAQLNDFNLFTTDLVTPKAENSPMKEISSSAQIYEFNFASQKSTFALDTQANLTEEDYAKQLMQTGLVEFAEPDYEVMPDMAVNDPLMKSQWYINTINAPTAWDTTTGNNKVQVLVCDTGINSNHPDLKGNILTQGLNFIDNSKNTEPSGNPHGTLVAGILGAKGNNGIGIAGLNWNIEIIPGKISNEANGMTHSSVMAKCIQWAIDNHIRIVNLSYSGTTSDAIISVSKSLFENNGMLFQTIGNKGEDLTAPNNPYAVTVGATDFYDFKAMWSNTGEALDMVAPGVSMYSTSSNGDYARVQGTSFSAPLVSGTAALLLSLNPNLKMSEVKQILLDSAKDLGIKGYDKYFGHGRLDVANAIHLYQQKYGSSAH